MDENSKGIRIPAWATGGILFFIVQASAFIGKIWSLEGRVNAQQKEISMLQDAEDPLVRNDLDHINDQVSGLITWRDDWQQRVYPLDALQDSAIAKNEKEISSLKEDVKALRNGRGL